MDLRFAEPLDLDQMAAQAGFSKFHFARAFKDAYGETPANYLTRRRVERAKDLLRSANLTVTEVCMLVGLLEPGLVQLPLLRAGRHVAERLPAGVGRPGRPTADPGLLPHGVERPRPADVIAGGTGREERKHGEA